MKSILILFVAFVQPALALTPLETAEDLRDVNSPALVAAFQSKLAAERTRAAIACGHIQKPECVDRLFGLLSDSIPSVVSESLFALGQLGWRSEMNGGREKEISGKLSAFLKSQNEGLRALAVEALGKVGLLETPTLVLPALSDPSSRVRAEALLAVYRYRLVTKLRDPEAKQDDLTDSVLKRVLELVSDSNPIVRRNVGFYFARVKDARGLPALRTLLGDSDTPVKLFALIGLTKNPDPDSTKALLDVANGKGPLAHKVAALQALAALPKFSEFAALNPLLKNPSFHVRIGAIQLLALNADDNEAKLLPLWKSDASLMVRAEALKALVKRKKTQPRELVVAALKDRSFRIRAAAVEASQALGSDRESLLLETFTHEKDRNVQAAILENVGDLESSTVFTAIEKALESSELMVRGTAVDTLVKRKESSVPVVAARVFAASPEHRWTEVRENLVAVLPTDVLRKVVTTDPESSVAGKARTELLKRGEENVPQVAAPKLSFSPFRDLRFDHNPVVTLETTKGRIAIECLAIEAPIHVGNFVGHVKKGFYDGLSFHRIVPNFVIQGGDPDGSGWGDAGFSLRAEVNRARYLRGALGMPRSSGFDTGGIQIFLTHIPTPHLDGQYTVFGRVVSGLDVIDRIELDDRIIRATAK